MPKFKITTNEKLLRTFTTRGNNKFILTEGQLLHPSEKRNIVVRNLYKERIITDNYKSYTPIEQKVYDETATRKIIQWVKKGCIARSVKTRNEKDIFELNNFCIKDDSINADLYFNDVLYSDINVFEVLAKNFKELTNKAKRAIKLLEQSTK